MASMWCQYLNVCIQAKGWTHEQLAKSSGVSRPTISEYLKGNQIPDINKFSEMINALGGSFLAFHKFSTKNKKQESKE